MLVLALPTLKVGGHFRVLRDRRNTVEACQYQRVVFARQAQHIVTWRMRFFCESQCHGSGECLEKWRKLRTIHTFLSFQKIAL